MSEDWESKLGRMRELADWAERLAGLRELSADGGEERAVRLDGVKALCSRLGARATQEGPPVLVAALTGPTGVGKSTVFRALTGIEVPAGGFRRPVSHAPCAALPPSDDPGATARALFPAFSCLPLDDPEQLAAEPPEDNALFFAEQREDAATGRFPFCLVDLPDFDSVEQQNEQRARRMLERAEVVLFAVSAEKYNDERSTRFLRLCCEEAGRLIVLLTKHEEEAHPPMHWEHLLEQARANPAFAGLRSDGQPLHGFLAASAVYYSMMLTGGGKLEPKALRPLGEGEPALVELLGGLESREILLAALANPARLAAREARGCLESLEHARERHTQRIERARAALREPLAPVVEGVPRPAELERECREIARRLGYRPSLLHMVRRLQQREQRPSGGSPAVPGSGLSPRTLGDICGRVHDLWRDAFPELATAGGPLSHDRFVERANAVRHEPIPEPESHWREELEAALVEWAAAKVLSKGRAGTVKRWGPLGGAAFFAGDLLLTSGVSTAAWGVLAAAGAIEGYAWREDGQFDRMAHEAIERWRAGRREQVARVLEERLAEPLFLGEWHATQQELERMNASELATLCDEFAPQEGTTGK